MGKSDKVSMGTSGVADLAAGVLSGKIALSVAGVSGLNATGITSGLAVIGRSMTGGIAVLAALPGGATADAEIGYGGYKACRRRVNKHDQRVDPGVGGT